MSSAIMPLLAHTENSHFFLPIISLFTIRVMTGLRRLIIQVARCPNNSRLIKSLATESRGLRTYCRLLFASSSSSQVPYVFPNFVSSSLYLATWATIGAWTRQRRTMFIQTQSTPNPLSLMFYPGKLVMEVGSADFPNARSAMNSPLAKALFEIDGIARVYFGLDFVTVTKFDDASWDFLKPEIFAAIMDFFSSEKPLFLDSNTATSKDTSIQEDDSETVAMIKELLETRIRPTVHDDGGDIEYRGFDAETGIVKLRMQGACIGCPSSSVTLKSGIENMLMHYVPEVKGVEQELYEDEDPTLTGAPHE